MCQSWQVAKAEKKKKLTGRAKKRFVYNRRFVPWLGCRLLVTPSGQWKRTQFLFSSGTE